MTLTFDRPGSLDRATSDWVRDEGRPLVKPDPDWTPEQTQAWLARPGTKDGERPYTRVTTFGEALLDGSMLSRWKMRRVALGMGRRPDYVVAAAALTAEDRDRAALNDLAEKCLEAAGPNAADIGTALHGFSERIDRGEPIGFVPPEYRADLERYREVVESHLTWRHREDRMVCDALEVAGTPDGIALCDQPDPDGVVDLYRIVDLKTGNIETTAGKFSCQLGIYAHSALYDPATGVRTWIPNLDTRWGLVLHMPAGAGTAELRWLNLEHGWLGAQIAGPVRKWRTVNHADLMRPLVPVERVVAEGMCRGVKRDGDPCGYKAKEDGLCTRHQGQEPDAVVPVRVRQVAAELEQAIENVPEPLRMGAAPLPHGQFTSVGADGAPGDQPEDWDPDPFIGITTTDAVEDQPAAELEQAIENVPEPLRIDQPATVPPEMDPVALAENWRRIEQEEAEMLAADDESTPMDEAVDDPLTWCDCRPGEQCPGGQLCRQRSNQPDPREPRELTTLQRAAAEFVQGAEDSLPQRCATTDLLPAQCACPVHRPDLANVTDEGVEPADGPRELPVELNGNPTPHTSMPDPESAREAAEHAEQALMDQVRACRTAGELEMLYQATGQAWTLAVKKYATRHRELLPELARAERTGAALHAAIVHAQSQGELRRLFEDPRNASLITQAHKDAAKSRAAELPPF